MKARKDKASFQFIFLVVQQIDEPVQVDQLKYFLVFWKDFFVF